MPSSGEGAVLPHSRSAQGSMQSGSLKEGDERAECGAGEGGPYRGKKA